MSPGQACTYQWAEGAGLLLSNVQVQVQVREGLGFGKERGNGGRQRWREEALYLKALYNATLDHRTALSI